MSGFASLIQTYGKELVSLAVPFVAWALNRLTKSRARLQTAQLHTFTFLVRPPVPGPNDAQPAPPNRITTRSIVVRNVGNEPATKVELVFNWEPMCINIWPSRHYTEHREQDRRYILIFDSLSPGEAIGCELLAFNAPLPDVITVRSDQSLAQAIPMSPQPVLSRAHYVTERLIMTVGLAASIYLALILIQFIVLKTPLGRGG